LKLEWSLYALADREGIFDYIEGESPRAAIAVDERIAAQVERLIDFPEAGRLGRVPDTRELTILRTPYVVAYRVLDNKVRILRVLHGAQLWPDDLPN
jgi:toxin ParE1/3/4